jgi:coniferyl-aldehyde dehydrogenase
MLVSAQARFVDSLALDFGQRPEPVSRFMDILPAVHSLSLARRKVRAWMQPERPWLGLPLGIPGARGEIVHQPLGVIGVISPWNFPLALTFGPLAGIFAAGNRCMIKPSELTPATSELMREQIARHFDPRELTVITGGPAVAEAFSRLPFDHLLFTGSGGVGRRVMAAAAENLVPVTLELGGKCPVVVGRSAVLSRAVDRILIAKMANAGQMCIAPDYVCVPEECVEEFVRIARQWAKRVYPGLPSNPDCTSLISDGHAHRIEELLSDAVRKGAEVVTLAADAPQPTDARRLFAPALVLRATGDMRILQEEIFGPVLPVLAYGQIEEVIGHINGRARPLALYYFGRDSKERRGLLARTRPGAVTVNDVGMHFFAEQLPFGGVGPSGMGAYHGIHGFRRFSHARAVFQMPRWDVAGLMGLRPPYSSRVRFWLDRLIRR